MITTAAGIVRESASRPIEEMLVIPVRPAELLVAKTLPPSSLDCWRSCGSASAMCGSLALFLSILRRVLGE